jgi:Zn-finger nucleic acid-binding protein
MSERQGIEIDYCPTCRGVWLDRGELDKIIERSSADDGRVVTPSPPVTQNTPPAAWPQGGHHGYHDKHDRDSHAWGQHGQRRSIWKDLFD